MRLVLLILLLLECEASARQLLPLRVRDGHVIILVSDKRCKPHEFIVDTGACISIVFDIMLLESVVRADDFLYGVGGKEVAVEYGGKLALHFVDAYAYYIESDEMGVDGILGLDWMLEHRAVIDLERMVLEYD